MERSVFLLPILLLVASCDSYSYTYAPESIDKNIERSKYSLEAFGGSLYGDSQGEFGGGLYFRDQADRSYEVIDQNVHGIVRNKAGVFVFTGLSHMSHNTGYIYRISVGADQHLVPARLGRLPGAPSQVHQHPDGVTSFLVYTGYLADGKHYKCLALDGLTVSESNLCDAPSHRSPNNSFKPSPLRGLGATRFASGGPA